MLVVCGCLWLLPTVGFLWHGFLACWFECVRGGAGVLLFVLADFVRVLWVVIGVDLLVTSVCFACLFAWVLLFRC